MVPHEGRFEVVSDCRMIVNPRGAPEKVDRRGRTCIWRPLLKARSSGMEKANCCGGSRERFELVHTLKVVAGHEFSSSKGGPD